MANEIDLKTIKDILEYKFYVPRYQRGYRWNKQQVTDLLEDIWEFSQKNELKKDEFYCLQPIVVKNTVVLGEDKWEVIDGQQRLTTIYIILTYIKNNILPKAATTFSLEYETRTDSGQFLKNIDEAEKYNNIDYYHMYNALHNATKWFESKGDETSTAIEIYNKLLNQTKFIWYQVNEDIDPIDIFTRINLGKIPLTNSELIKALFLKKENFGSESEKERIHMKQLEIANEWDQIEYSLQKEDFWYFLYNGSYKYETRIEFILNLMSREVNNQFDVPIEESNNEYFSFLVFNKLFKEEEQRIKNGNLSYHNSPIDNLWLRIKKYFMTFEEWFNNRQFYHLVGYLVSVDVKIEELKRETETMTKLEQLGYFHEKIRSSIFSRKDLEDWDYNLDRKKIKNVLLLFNVISLLSNKNSNIRFPFDSYKIEDWDIEHIHAVNSEMPNDKKHRVDWLKAAQDEIDNKVLANKIKQLIEDDLVSDENAFVELYNEILVTYGDNEDINDISNLTLLDAATNRSYKNAIFPVKRKIILENDRRGTFIPICTKNVFLKYYSEDIRQMTFWGNNDRKRYFNNITETLKDFLPFRGLNNE
ncbi:DUF262 domain-containing protein [Bacillus sp. CECT 9360]|uniref:DUF262 domain-containing protein n=1 Tax=Bacillus sp. CECT 9360 TaxID=2845821 RepID=UPI001E2B89AD|nr:DUF262 domain-containing protein [Bacillus sp. CECT 9360]CAH0346764.1 hypothetical protein BCI9360_03110 [Bacillus sp. CECT 9360]